MGKGEHHYRSHLTWDGNRGEGTARYDAYGREYRVAIEGKPDLHGTADAAFRGDPGKHNPEDLFLISLSSCHMLSYLALCAKYGISVMSYEDEATGTMQEDGRGGGRFVEVMLRPLVTIADAQHAERATALHDRAHDLCFIAASCNVPVHHEAVIRVAEARA